MSTTDRQRCVTVTHPNQNGDSAMIQVGTVPTDRLTPNNWNPNRMTDEQYAELLAEIRELGRLPKPIVARPNGDGRYVIIDGEHGWRAAQAVGFSEVPVEVIEADDFEAMRQTYKRNQHGEHDPVREGLMFRRMIEARKLSNRQLAEDAEVSEGKIRTGLLYAKAADMRCDALRRQLYSDDTRGEARERANEEIAALSVRQVRFYRKLPKQIRDIWLEEGPPVEDFKVGGWTADIAIDAVIKDMTDSGLLDYFQFTNGLLRDLEALREWDRVNEQYACEGVSVEDLRPYTHLYFRGPLNNWYRDRLQGIPSRWMTEHMNMLVRPGARRARRARRDADEPMPEADRGCIRLSLETFSNLAKEATDTGDFTHKLRAAIYKATGENVDPEGDVRATIARMDIEANAPDYIHSIEPVHPLDKEEVWHDEKMTDEGKRLTLEAIAAHNKEQMATWQAARRGARAMMGHGDDGNDDDEQPEVLRVISVRKFFYQVRREQEVEGAINGEPAKPKAERIARLLYGIYADDEPTSDEAAGLAARLCETFTNAELGAMDALLRWSSEDMAVIAPILGSEALKGTRVSDHLEDEAA